MSEASAKTVLLGGEEFRVKVVPVARVKLIIPVMTALFEELAKEQKEVGFETVVDKLLEAPHKFLSIFISDLPVKVFTDVDNGATLPEILKAFEVVMELNRLDVLKNVFSRLSTEWLKGMQKQARR